MDGYYHRTAGREQMESAIAPVRFFPFEFVDRSGAWYGGIGKFSAAAIYPSPRRRLIRLKSNGCSVLFAKAPVVIIPPMLWKSLTWIKWAFGWPIGLDLGYLDAVGPTAAKSVYGEVISLFGLAITNGIALTLSVRQTYAEPPPWLWFAFGIVSMTVVAGLICILRAESTVRRRWTGWSADGVFADGAKRTHAFERGSIMFARWSLPLVGALIVTLVWAGQAQELPGQGFVERTPAKLEKPEGYTTAKTKQMGVKVGVTLGERLYPKGLPAQLEGEIVLKGDMARKWKVGKVELVYASATGEPEHPAYLTPAARPVKDDKEARKWDFSLEALKPRMEYRLTVYLRPADPKIQPLVDPAIEAINGGDAMTVTFLSKKTR